MIILPNNNRSMTDLTRLILEKFQRYQQQLQQQPQQQQQPSYTAIRRIMTSDHVIICDNNDVTSLIDGQCLLVDFA